MKINKKSWHYRLYDGPYDGRTSGNVSLCRYCQVLFWMSVMYVSLAAAVVSFVGLFFYHTFWQHPGITFGVIGAVALTIGAIWLIVRGVQSHRRKHYNDPPREPGLVTSWAKARKDKVCPLLEFVDDEEVECDG